MIFHNYIIQFYIERAIAAAAAAATILIIIII